MANDKKKTEASNPSENDWTKELLPEGYDAKDVIETGLLTPMYLPKEAYGEKFPPVAGILDRVTILDAQTSVAAKGSDEKWFPMNVLVRELKFATKGCRGNYEKRQIVDVAEGGEILVPITGQITVNRELTAAIQDVASLYWFMARVTGFEKVNSGNEMARWDIRILKLKESRASKGARYALPPWYVLSTVRGDMATSIRNAEPCGVLGDADLIKRIALTPDGKQLYDASSGEVVAVVPGTLAVINSNGAQATA